MTAIEGEDESPVRHHDPIEIPSGIAHWPEVDGECSRCAAGRQHCSMIGGYTEYGSRTAEAMHDVPALGYDQPTRA